MMEGKPLLQEVDEFKTLMGLGKFISAVGWLAVGIGTIGSLYCFGYFDYAWARAMIGLWIGLALFGLLLVTNGQLISCFVSIERNTARQNKLLGKLLDSLAERISKE